MWNSVCLFLFGLISAISFVFFYEIKQWNYVRRKLRNIPGPEQWFLIGNATLLLGGPVKAFKTIDAEVRKFGDVLKARLLHKHLVVLSAPEDLEKILSNPIHNVKGFIYDPLKAWLNTGLLISSGEKWVTRRKILTPAFHFNVLQNFLPVFVNETNKLVKILNDEICNENTDVIPLITKFTLNSICETAMGIKLLDEEKESIDYRKAVYDMGEHIVHRITHPWLMENLVYYLTPSFWKEQSVSKFLHQFSQNVIEKRKHIFKQNTSGNNNPNKVENRSDDNDNNEDASKGNNGFLSYSKSKRLAMLDMLLSASISGLADIDEEGIREEVDTFMFEGHDTTSVCICFTLMLLACNKDCQDKIFEEVESVFGKSDRDPTYNDLQSLKYTELCIKESLRLYPSVPIISRVLGEDVQSFKDGYILPKGCNTILSIYHLHRRPDLFSEPERYIPERFSQENYDKRRTYGYVPFSAGSRNCIGQKFALMELKTVIAGIIRHFILEPLDTPDTITLKTDVVLRTVGQIRIKFRARK